MTMDRRYRVFSVGSALTFALLVMLVMRAMPAAAAQMTSDERAVWQLEQKYWVYVAKSDIEAYRTLWDERFVGWPSFSATPVGKDKIGAWIPPLHADAEQKFEYSLEQMAVRSFGEVVVVHYLVTERWVSVKTGQVTRTETSRITHTWKRRDNGWAIIGGMSSVQATK